MMQSENFNLVVVRVKNLFERLLGANDRGLPMLLNYTILWNRFTPQTHLFVSNRAGYMIRNTYAGQTIRIFLERENRKRFPSVELLEITITTSSFPKLTETLPRNGPSLS